MKILENLKNIIKCVENVRKKENTTKQNCRKFEEIQLKPLQMLEEYAIKAIRNIRKI